MKTELSDLAAGGTVAQVASTMLGRGCEMKRQWGPGMHPISDDGRCRGIDRGTLERLLTLGTLHPS